MCVLLLEGLEPLRDLIIGNVGISRLVFPLARIFLTTDLNPDPLQLAIDGRKDGLKVFDAEGVGRTAMGAAMVDLPVTNVKPMDELGCPPVGEPAPTVEPEGAITCIVPAPSSRPTRPQHTPSEWAMLHKLNETAESRFWATCFLLGNETTTGTRWA